MSPVQQRTPSPPGHPSWEAPGAGLGNGLGNVLSRLGDALPGVWLRLFYHGIMECPDGRDPQGPWIQLLPCTDTPKSPLCLGVVYVVFFPVFHPSLHLPSTGKNFLYPEFLLFHCSKELLFIKFPA